MKTIKIVLIVLLALCWAYSCSADADYLSGSYNNIQREIMRNHTDDTDHLVNPVHQMSEGILLDQSKISASPQNASLQNGAVTYYTKFDYIPVPWKLLNASNQKNIDYTYRGKMILFGEEYYVRDIDAPGFISACKGKVISNLNDQTFTGNYLGYNFRVDEKVFDCNDQSCWVAGANLSVTTPLGQTRYIQVKDRVDTTVDAIEISLINVLDLADNHLNASIIVYDTSNEAILENGYALNLGGSTKPGWIVSITAKEQPFDAGMDISEYAHVSTNQYLFANATIRYTTPATLNAGQYLSLPSAYYIGFDGNRVYSTDTTTTTTTTSTTTTTTSSTTTTIPNCSMIGDQPPCGQVSLPEVITLINAWATGQANLNDVIALINAWAAG